MKSRCLVTRVQPQTSFHMKCETHHAIHKATPCAERFESTESRPPMRFKLSSSFCRQKRTVLPRTRELSGSDEKLRGPNSRNREAALEANMRNSTSIACRPRGETRRQTNTRVIDETLILLQIAVPACNSRKHFYGDATLLA